MQPPDHPASDAKPFIFNRAYVGYPDFGQPLYHTLRLSTVRQERGNVWLDGCLLLIGIAIFLLFMGTGLVTALLVAQPGLLLILIPLTLTVLVFVFRGISRAYREERRMRQVWQRLIQPGATHILPGTVIACQVHTYAGRGRITYRTVVRYHFTTPDSQDREGEQTVRGEIDVPAGTRVSVLYADASTFVLL